MAGNPFAENPLVAAEGLANLANSVRRSTALYVAMSITPADGTVDELLSTADRLALWLRGSAPADRVSPGQPPQQQFMGLNPWEQS